MAVASLEVAPSPNILEINGVSKRFGGLTAVDRVSFAVRRGEIFALIGPNGAGKTTLFNCITGQYPPSEGQIVFDGVDISGTKPHQAAQIGIARTFQNIRLFAFMTALDNVRVGQHVRMHAKLWDAMLKTPAARREESEVRDRSMELLRYVGVERYADSYARNLPYGMQRRLEVARALATRPQLLLLDEPAAGFTPQEKVELLRLIEKIVADGVTVFLIEHDMKVVMGCAKRICVLDHGEEIALGGPEEVRASKRVIEAYLGSQG
ncbi:MAG: ABC transporter ATP-binding protein [Candidatus Dormibacteraeota bacterium]|nr:ABC transporter ATP-binding protein [Candidatus Dormibacteraeota bacterium]